MDARALASRVSDASSVEELELREMGGDTDTDTDEGNAPLLKNNTPLPTKKINNVKNIVALCLSFFLLFSSYSALQNISGVVIPEEDGINWGLLSIGSIYICLTVSSLIAPAIISRTSEKWGMVLGSVSYSMFMASYFYPTPWLLMPTACILGVGASILWTGQGAYLTRIALIESRQSGKSLEKTVSLYNSAFWGTFTTTQIVGNGIGTLIFHMMHTTPETGRTILFAVYTGFAVSGTCLFVLLTSDTTLKKTVNESVVKGDDTANAKAPRVIDAIVTNIKLIGDWRVGLLIPLLIYSGLQSQFAWSFITTVMIGEVKRVNEFLVYYGLCDVVSSVTFGKIGTKVRYNLIYLSVAFVIQGAVVVYLSYEGYPGIHYNYSNGYQCLNNCWLWYLTVVLFGVGDGIVNTQIANTISTLYDEQLATHVYSQLKLWQSMAVALMFFVNGSVEDKGTLLYVNSSVLIFFGFLSFVGYVNIYKHREDIRDFQLVPKG